MLYTLSAHIQLDKLREIEQRLRAILVEAQRGEYTRSAFVESVQPIITELYLCSQEETLTEVGQQLSD